MAKRFDFSDFFDNEATVYSPTQTTDDMMGVVDEPWAAKTAVGVDGVIQGNLQTLTGVDREIAARRSSVVEMVYFPDAVYDIVIGDRLVIDGKNYDVVWAGDDSGTGESPTVYLRRVT